MDFDNLHQILRDLYTQMMPLCGTMAGVAKGIAGLGALFYVSYRVWQSLARTEPTSTVWKESKTIPCHALVIWQNALCSIGFHLEQ